MLLPSFIIGMFLHIKYSSRAVWKVESLKVNLAEALGAVQMLETVWDCTMVV